MTATVATLAANEPLMARLALVVTPVADIGTCATDGCDSDHGIGRKYCSPCREERDKARRRRWWAENRSGGRRAA